MTNAEPFCAKRSKPSWTRASFRASRALVASSSKIMSGCLTMARAMAMRCRCPPEKLEAPAATSVMSFSGLSSMKSHAQASRHALSTSASLTGLSIP
mmetsp:Transcript_133947/g.298724  ORF Transcript_133947/g.298724 Transcript_133947/m.298724 type:complete len:97 (+) Transcript_133947:450-740(+)